MKFLQLFMKTKQKKLPLCVESTNRDKYNTTNFIFKKFMFVTDKRCLDFIMLS